jgi:stage II sporulation protein E
MIYREDIKPYKRLVGDGKPGFARGMSLFSTAHMILYVSAFFAARVLMMKVMMPFGLAFFVASYGALGKQVAFITGITTMIGYISTFKGYASLGHIVTLAMLMLSIFLLNHKNKGRVYKMGFLALVINSISSIFIHYKFISGGFIMYDGILSILESVIVVAGAFIFNYGIPLYFQGGKRKILSMEEMICLSLMAAIVVSGMWDIKYMGFSLKNMVAFFIVLSSGYIKGPAIGAAAGVTLGLVSSISDATMPMSLGIYAFCGLISGVFREIGKVLSAAAFIISGAILSFYTAGLLSTQSLFLDTLAPAIVFLLIPKKQYEKIGLFVDGDKRSVELQKTYIERVKDLMNIKLASVSTTLSGLSDILEQNVESELNKKTEVNALVESLADKVCANCDGRNLCWKRELYYTYDSFADVFRIIEKNGKISPSDIPDSLKRKCLRPTELVKQVNYLFEIFRLNNSWKKKLINSRIIVAEQVKGISGLVTSMMDEVATSMEFKNDIEKEIAVALDRQGLEFDDILAVKNSKDKYEVTVYRQPCAGTALCTKGFATEISKTLGVKMVRNTSNCKINNECSVCQFSLVEAENYSVITAIARSSKEEVSGDSHTYGSIGHGRYMLALSDGMGSGVRAAQESNTTITLLEKFMEAGFERNTALKAINSVLVLRSCNESFATIDMGLIDLYNGVGEFVKIGAASTFIKSGMEIDIINSTSLPAGILDEIDVESQIVEFRNGDMIVMVSDGIVDSNSELKERWVTKALREFDSGNPKDIADYLLNKAKEYSGSKQGDDMTVIVSKVLKIM